MICNSDFWFSHSEKESMKLGEVLALIQALKRVELRCALVDLLDPVKDVFEPVDVIDLLPDLTKEEWEVILCVGLMRAQQLAKEDSKHQTAVALLDELELSWIGRLPCHDSACVWLGVPVIPKAVVPMEPIAA